MSKRKHLRIGYVGDSAVPLCRPDGAIVMAHEVSTAQFTQTDCPYCRKIIDFARRAEDGQGEVSGGTEGRIEVSQQNVAICTCGKSNSTCPIHSPHRMGFASPVLNIADNFNDSMELVDEKELATLRAHTCPVLSAELEKKVRERIAEIRIELRSFVKGRTNNQVAILNHERDALNGVLREAGLEGKS